MHGRSKTALACMFVALACAAVTRPAAAQRFYREPTPNAASAPDPKRSERLQLFPPGAAQTPERAPPSPLVEVGFGLWGGTYVASFAAGLGYLVFVYPVYAALAGLSPEHPREVEPEPALISLMLPFAGPFIAADTRYARDKPGLRIAYYADGALQVGGFVLGFVGLIMTEHERGKRELAGWDVVPSVTGAAFRYRFF